MIPRAQTPATAGNSSDIREGMPSTAGSTAWRLAAGRWEDAPFTAGTELKAIKLFNSFDEDGGGSMSTTELDGGLRTMGIKLKEEVLDLLVKRYDADESGELDINEWVALVRDAIKTTQTTLKKKPKPQYEFMRELIAENLRECVAALTVTEADEQAPESASETPFVTNCNEDRKSQTTRLEEILLEAMERVAFYALGSRGEQRRFQFVDVLSALRPGWRPLYNHPLQEGPEKDHLTSCFQKLQQLEPQRRIEAATVLDQAWCIEELFMHGAPCNTRNQRGYTPLHIAASQNNLQCVEVLLNMKPYFDVSPLTDKGFTPYFLAKSCKASPSVQLMLFDLDDADFQSRPHTPTPAQDFGHDDGIPVGALLWSHLCQPKDSKGRCTLPYLHAMAVTDCDEDENEKDNTSTGSHDSSIHYEFEPHTVQDYLAANFLLRELNPSTGDVQAVAEFWPGRIEELISSDTFSTLVYFLAEMAPTGDILFPTRTFKHCKPFANTNKALKRLLLLTQGLPLKEIEVHATTAHNTLDPIEHFTEVHTMTLRGFCGSMTALSKLSLLERLDIQSCPVTGLEALSSCTSLQRLDLSRTAIEGNLEPLRALNRLLELRLSYCQKIDGSLEPLVACISLRELNLEGCFIRDVVTYRQTTTTTVRGVRGSLAPLGSLRNLEVCNLWGCELFSASADEVTSRGALQSLAACTNLRILVLWGCKGLIGSLEPLVACTALKKVDVQKCPGLSGIPQFKESHPGCVTLS